MHLLFHTSKQFFLSFCYTCLSIWLCACKWGWEFMCQGAIMEARTENIIWVTCLELKLSGIVESTLTNWPIFSQDAKQLIHIYFYKLMWFFCFIFIFFFFLWEYFQISSFLVSSRCSQILNIFYTNYPLMLLNVLKSPYHLGVPFINFFSK